MYLGEKLVLRGAILGSILVGFCGFMITAGASLPPPPAVSLTIPEEPVTVDVEEEIPQEFGEQNPNPLECQVSGNYPKKVRQWCDLITQHSHKNNLPSDLIAAVIWQESGGNPKAYSRSGAVGLMQVMPRDGLAAEFSCVNGPCFASRPTMDQLKDPEFNIKYGTRMLAALVKRHGDLREALKAYGPLNAGYSYADKVIQLYKKYGN